MRLRFANLGMHTNPHVALLTVSLVSSDTAPGFYQALDGCLLLAPVIETSAHRSSSVHFPGDRVTLLCAVSSLSRRNLLKTALSGATMVSVPSLLSAQEQPSAPPKRN